MSTSNIVTIPRTCIECGNLFTATYRTGRKPGFCSNDCRGRAYLKAQRRSHENARKRRTATSTDIQG